eukprot:2034106-Pleurochrysis_carterae.AAC.1
MALPCRAPLTAKSPKLCLSPLALPVPAIVVVVQERVTQWRRQPCPSQKVQVQPIPPLDPSQSVSETCLPRDSESRRSVPKGPGPFVPPPNRAR